jgi:hypothetical protein
MTNYAFAPSSALPPPEPLPPQVRTPPPTSARAEVETTDARLAQSRPMSSLPQGQQDFYRRLDARGNTLADRLRRDLEGL